MKGIVKGQLARDSIYVQTYRHCGDCLNKGPTFLAIKRQLYRIQAKINRQSTDSQDSLLARIKGTLWIGIIQAYKYRHSDNSQDKGLDKQALWGQLGYRPNNLGNLGYRHTNRSPQVSQVYMSRDSGILAIAKIQAQEYRHSDGYMPGNKGTQGIARIQEQRNMYLMDSYDVGPKIQALGGQL